LSTHAALNRHDFLRHQRRVLDHLSENLRVLCYRREQDVDELVDQVEKVCTKTYQRSLGVGFRPDAETLDLLHRTARRRALRGYVLCLENQRRAFFIGHKYKGTFHGQYTGFDPECVLLRAIENCFDPDLQASRFGLGWGNQEYKRITCDQSRIDGPRYLYAPSWTGLALNVLRSGTSLLDLAATTLLRRSESLRRWKKGWLRRKNYQQILKAEGAAK